jgi:perosamine synthetase
MGSDIRFQALYPKPVHKQRNFLKIKLTADLPVTECASQEILSLPIHPFMRDKEVSGVINVLNGADHFLTVGR